MIAKSLVRKYYKGFDPWLPGGVSHYHFRVRCLDGRWKKLLRINSKKKLIKELQKVDAGDVYFSTALWLNPEKVGPKSGRKGFEVADSLMVGEDHVFDFDPENTTLEGMDVSRKNTLRFLRFMKKQKKFVKNYILFTGRGFHLSYKKIDEKVCVDPRKRVLEAEKNRKRFKKRLPKGIKLDINTYLNPLLIRRLPGTINTKTGYIATLLTEKMLRKPISELLKHIPYVTRGRPGIPAKAVEMTNIPSDIIKGRGGVAGLAPPTKIMVPCYTNQVLSVTNRFVLVLKYHPNQNYERDVLFLQKHYKLSDVYVAKSKELNRKGELEERIYVFTAQTFPHARLKKLLGKTSALNKNEQGKLKYTKIPITNYVFKEIKKSRNPVKAGSKAHKKLINKFLGCRPRAWSWEGDGRFNLMLSIKG